MSPIDTDVAIGDTLRRQSHVSKNKIQLGKTKIYLRIFYDDFSNILQ